MRIEAARAKLSRLVITKDYRIILADYDNKEVELTPVHKAVYLLFLAHPEGIEFKKLRDYRDELARYYMATARQMDKEAIMESVDMLVDPLNNSINEKCSRIKKVFLDMMDEYTASYYIISGHTQKHIGDYAAARPSETPHPLYISVPLGELQYRGWVSSGK